jgi:hypothetical protein
MNNQERYRFIGVRGMPPPWPRRTTPEAVNRANPLRQLGHSIMPDPGSSDINGIYLRMFMGP